MRLGSKSLRLLCPLVTALAALAVPAHAQGPLRLNEFMAGPARDWDGDGVFSSRDDEWIEVVNTGGSPLDLPAFLVTDGDSIPRLALSGTLPPGGHLVLTGRQSYDWERANGYPAFGFSLANGGDRVILWQVVGAETLLVDTYTYRSHEAAADRAVGRHPDAIGTWVIFDALNPYTGSLLPPGNGCPPTPGNINLCEATPTLRSSWGRVKTLYR
jgi:lamin tail-like protein